MIFGFKDYSRLKALERRIKTILPAEYQDCYEEVEPVSMGSAGIKYQPDGKVAWNEMWNTFCDLAMAGGPPHKGTLLEPGSSRAIVEQPDRHRGVVEEICRGVTMVSGLPARPSPTPGWVRVECSSSCMSQWLLRAIVMENVAAQAEANLLDLPAGPAYRVEKEIKNVVTVIAKTSHYWLGHMGPSQQRAIDDLFAEMAPGSPLIQPSWTGAGMELDAHRLLRGEVSAAIHRTTGLPPSAREYPGWVGAICPDVRSAIWMMRALVASNVLARREETELFVPVNPATDPDGQRVVQMLAQMFKIATKQGLL